jgi:hypothetical protein
VIASTLLTNRGQYQALEPKCLGVRPKDQTPRHLQDRLWWYFAVSPRRSPKHITAIWQVQLLPTPQNGLSKPSAVDTLQIRGMDLQHFIRKMGVSRPGSWTRSQLLL